MTMNRYNSTFKVKLSAKSMKRSGTLKRSPMKRSRRPMNKVGQRTSDWRKVWRFLKPELEKRGRTRCELGFIPHECGGFLTPAHSKKRRMMKGNDIFAVALACVNVHRILDERMTHKEMEVAVMRAIEEHGGLILPEQRKAA